MNPTAASARTRTSSSSPRGVMVLKLFGAGGAAAILTTLGLAGGAKNRTPQRRLPSETAGPYPGDGSSGPARCSTELSGSSATISGAFVRRPPTTLATGVPLRVNLTVTDASRDYPKLHGVAVTRWHCDRSGKYSHVRLRCDRRELPARGIVRTDSDGWRGFRTIFPACYSGRWLHIHFEVYAFGRQGGKKRAHRQDLWGQRRPPPKT